MKTAYQILTEFKGNEFDFEETVRELEIRNDHNNHVFDNLYAVFTGDKKKARKAVLYILYAYSNESLVAHLKQQWDKIKAGAANKAGLNEEMRRKLVNFEFTFVPKEKKEGAEDDGVEEVEVDDYAVRKIVTCIKDYLNYQKDPDNKHLKNMQMLYDQFSEASLLMKPMNAKGDIDWNQKATCQKEASRLKKEIEEFEKRMSEKHAPLRQAEGEISDLVKKHETVSLRPELA